MSCKKSIGNGLTENQWERRIKELKESVSEANDKLRDIAARRPDPDFAGPVNRIIDNLDYTVRAITDCSNDLTVKNFGEIKWELGYLTGRYPYYIGGVSDAISKPIRHILRAAAIECPEQQEKE